MGARTIEGMQDENKKINIPEVDLPVTPQTVSEFENDTVERISRIEAELQMGFQFIKSHPKSVTIFGSARFKEDDEHYQAARELAGRLSAEGYAIVTGGGPGIMEAANRGAQETEGNEHSLGMCIQLPHEQVTNPYVTSSANFHYFFTRKVLMSFAAEAYIYYPGGFGTLDEFFELLTLVQTKKIPKLPIILVGNDYWKPLDAWIKHHLLEDHAAINPEDTDLYTITEDVDEIVNIVKNAPLRDE